jgi:SAM-dependent methyltransferase
VFDDWARDYHADGMEKGHRPRVEQAWATLAPREDGDYLEIGVGNGYAIRHMATGPFAGGRCVGLDLSPHMAERARKATRDLENVRIECADFLEWQPEPDLEFGLIFSMEVFYYFPDIQRGIDHAASLLRPGGTLMVLVNHYAEHEASLDWPAQLDTPMTAWPAAEYRAAFERAGLVDIHQEHYKDPPDVADARDPGTLATRGRRR